MAGSDEEGADQSIHDEETSPTSDGQQLESARGDAAGDSSPNQGSTEESAQRSIRDMLDDEGEASVFVNRDLVEPDTIIDEERIVGRDDQLESVVSFLKPTLQGNRPPNMLLYGPAGTVDILPALKREDSSVGGSATDPRRQLAGLCALLWDGESVVTPTSRGRPTRIARAVPSA